MVLERKSQQIVQCVRLALTLGRKFAPPRIMEEPRCEVVLDTPYRTVRRQNADVGKSREELAEMQCYTIE